MLFAVVRLSQLEQIIQTKELAYSLGSAPTGNQAVVGSIKKQEFINIRGLHQLMGAGLDAGGRVAARVVRDRASDVAPQLGQVAGEFVDPVDGAEIDLSCFVVDD